VYRRDTCLPAVRDALEAGERKMIAWFHTVRVREMTAAEVGAIDPDFRSFINVNSPEEFRQAEQQALRLEGG
jgi:molybdopterin-guanine dinucleotide biosynthesis protein A